MEKVNYLNATPPHRKDISSQGVAKALDEFIHRQFVEDTGRIFDSLGHIVASETD